MTMETITKKKTRPFYRSKLFIGGIIALVVLLLAGYTGVCFYAVSKFTTPGVKDLGPDNPAKYGMPYEKITFHPTDDAKLTLHGWWLPRENATRALVLVHSKDGTRTFLLPIAFRMWEAGYNILMFDMRGWGESDGNMATFGYKERFDVVGAVNFIKDKGFSPARIGAIGWSLGAATTLNALGETKDISAALLESCYANLDRHIQAIFSKESGLPDFFYPGIKLTAKTFFDFDIEKSQPEKVLPTVGGRKIFLIHTENDEIFPVSNYYDLLKVRGDSVDETWMVPGSKHVRAFQDHTEEYVQRAVAFFDRKLAK